MPTVTLKTKQQVLREITETYLAKLDPQNPPPMDEIAAKLVHDAWAAYNQYNMNFSEKERKWKYPDHLEPVQIADIILRLYRVALICFAPHADGERDSDLLAIYQTEGKDKGLYITDASAIERIACSLYYNITRRELDEVNAALRRKAPVINSYEAKHRKRNLIAVNNGIFDYDAKQLLPFTPDEVFLSKSPIDYVPGAVNPMITNPDGSTWDVESWMRDLSDDEGVPELLWELIGAVIRPNVSWNISAWLYSETGNNGKGTLCSLMRNICGKSHASLPIAEMGKDFMLEAVVGKSAIITDENDVGIYLDKCANLKAIITGDPIMINRKFKPPITYSFRGFMVQCLNELPKLRDRSDSIYRRQLFVPFRKCFNGRERKYIKDDYLKRKEVMEYVLKRVLEMNYYELSVPPACKETLEEYKIYNDPVRQFWDDLADEFVWDLLPQAFLYAMYLGWNRKNNPGGSSFSKKIFLDNLKQILKSDSEWEFPDKPVTTGYKLSTPEPLLREYENYCENVRDWMNPLEAVSSPRRYMPTPSRVSGSYRGVVRKQKQKGAAPAAAWAQAGTAIEKKGE